MATVAAARLWTGTAWMEPGALRHDGGRITEVFVPTGPVPDRVLAPGFVDCQLNGIDDIDLNAVPAGDPASGDGPQTDGPAPDGDGAGGVDWDRLDRLVARQGTTTWCPTLITAPLAHYPARLAAIAAAAPRLRTRVAGVHLEGPFLGAVAGAHDPALVQPLDLAWLAGLAPIVRLVTLGPEQPLAVEATRLLVARGVVVSVGHSAAGAARAAAVFDAGATMATHLFNAMAPLHHRDPGIVGAALADGRVVPSVIADLVHLDPVTLRVVFAAKADVVLVTDSVAWRSGRPVSGRGRPPSGTSTALGADGAPRLDGGRGALAGSALTMDRAVANVVHACGVDLGRALRAASTVPAAVLGLADRGVLAPGRLADLVALDSSLAVEETWVGGVAID